MICGPLRPGLRITNLRWSAFTQEQPGYLRAEDAFSMETMELHTIGVNLGKTVLEHIRQGYSHDTGRLLTEREPFRH